MFANLSWDLFIFVFFAIVLAYSFIIGRKGTTKIILSSYVAILTTDGIGNGIGNFISGQFAESEALKKSIAFIGFTGGIFQFTAFSKIALLIALIVVIAKWGSFDVEVQESTGLSRFALNALLAFFSGGLILSIILVFANGGSLITGSSPASAEFTQVYNQSRLIKFMLDWHNFWFAAPGAIFAISSFLDKKD